MVDPINHHYLPKFYINKFGFQKKKRKYKVYSFDKLFNKNIIPMDTGNICCEKHRNTLELDGEKSYWVEYSLSELEGIFSKLILAVENFFLVKRFESIRLLRACCYDKIALNEHLFFFMEKKLPKSYFTRVMEYRPFIYIYEPRSTFDVKFMLSSTDVSALKEIPEAIKLISFFISTSFWRLEKNDLNFDLKFKLNEVTQCFEKEVSGFDNEFNSLLESNVKPLVSDISSVIDCGQNKNLKIIYRNLIYPIFSSYLSDVSGDLSFYVVKSPKNNMLSSDYPFIFDNSLGLNMKAPFVFVWSSKYILLASRQKPIIDDVEDFCFKVSVVSHLQSSRYSFCNSKEQMCSVIDAAQNYNDVELMDLKNEILAHLL
ncbi:hypothetical protein C9I94_24400 [Photobacterium swingsii]|uniref:DUF4238 domain-containing protein n=2 Tax=Photobacterium swingsii TaxID=680026 RepID=A0A2T3NQZ9_9GAMM|nr:DUF4238 domain-containing protein [Photobacterium swingsii]PSW18671.1 hypothetical protein C9I94_24400 [Photobacterium swingsii]